MTAGDAETPGALTLSALSSNQSLITPARIVFAEVAGAGRTVTLTPLPDASGQALITLMVTDGLLSTTTTFTLTVNPVDDPPSMSPVSAGGSILEDAAIQTFPVSGITSGPGENQPLTVTAVSGNPTLVPHPQVNYSSPAATATLSYTPLPDISGTALITITGGDGQATNGTITRSFSVTVLPVDDPPALDAIPDPAPLQNDAGAQTVSFGGISAGGGETGVLTVIAASSNPTLIPQPQVTYSSGAAGGTLQYAPAAAQSGSALITVTVNDGNSTASQSFTVRVQPLLHGEAASVVEGNAGAVFLSFRLFLDSPQLHAVKVDCTVEAASAHAGSDFTTSSGTAVIAAGETGTFVRVNVIADTGFETDETLTLVLTNP